MYRYIYKILPISGIIILVFGVTISLAQQKTKVSGTTTAAVTEEKMFEIGDVEGHAMVLSKQEGVNLSKGTNPFMDGAQVINISADDIIKGTGKHQSYVKYFKMMDTVYAKCEGKSTMTVAPDGTPNMSIEGTFAWIKGTGKYQNIQGIGSYKGKFISRTIWTLDWQGEYSFKK